MELTMTNILYFKLYRLTLLKTFNLNKINFFKLKINLNLKLKILINKLNKFNIYRLYLINSPNIKINIKFRILNHFNNLSFKILSNNNLIIIMVNYLNFKSKLIFNNKSPILKFKILMF